MIVTQLMAAKFHGHIVEIDYAENELYLLMKKVEDDEPYGTDYEYTLPLEAVREEDKDLVSEGATFFFETNKYINEDGKLIMESDIKLRRLGPYSADEIKEIEERANQLCKDLKWDNKP